MTMMAAWKSQLTKFLLVGSLSTSLNYLVFFICLNALHVYYLVASIIGYFSGFAVGYLLNRNWTFSTHKSDSQTHREVAAYLFVNTVSLLCSLFCLRLLVDGLAWPAWFSNILAIGVSTTTNFIGLKFFVFKTPKSSHAI